MLSALASGLSKVFGVAAACLDLTCTIAHALRFCIHINMRNLSCCKEDWQGPGRGTGSYQLPSAGCTEQADGFHERYQMKETTSDFLVGLWGSLRPGDGACWCLEPFQAEFLSAALQLEVFYILMGIGRAVYESTNKAIFADFFPGEAYGLHLRLVKRVSGSLGTLRQAQVPSQMCLFSALVLLPLPSSSEPRSRCTESSKG